MAFRGVTGNIPDVTDDHQLKIIGAVESDLEYASEVKGKAYTWTSSFATGGTDVEVISIKNTSSTDILVIDEIVVASVLTCVFTLFEVTSGTAAGTSITGQNLNLSSGLSASATAFGDAAVTGSLSGNTLAYESVAATDSQTLDTKGGLILGQDDEIAITASANTTVYVTVIGHYKVV
jgi:hypothetical protein